MKQVNQDKAGFAAIAWTIDNRPDQVKSLVKKHGIDVPVGSGKAGIQKAVAALMAKSKGFAKDFSQLFRRENTGEFANFVYATGDSGEGSLVSNTSSGSSTKKAFADTTVGKVFSSDNISNWINTGLGVWAAKKTGQGGNAADNINTGIDYGRDYGTGGSGNSPAPASKGIGTTGIILISLGAVALLGTVIYLATRKK